MNLNKSAISALAAVALSLSMTAAGAARQEAIEARNAAKSGTSARLGANLAILQRESARRIPQSDVTAAATRKSPALRAANGYVSISAYGDDLSALRAQLVAKGLLDATQHPTAISGRAPVSALADMAASTGLKFLRPTLAMARASVKSQGDRSLRADLARREAGVNGKGVRIGVLSDSYDCLPGAFEEGAPFTRAAEDIANGDLPRDPLILKDLAIWPNGNCSDEGRAMMQLIHDVAPGSPLAFHTAFISEADFAAGIRALAAAGSKVIVDDVIYFAEPMFEDGIIAQAVDDVHRDGVAYFSSAGNDARNSYESRFRLSTDIGISGARHDFASGRTVDALQTVTAGASSITYLPFNWDQPSISANGTRGALSDVDVWFYDMNGDPIEPCSSDPDQLVCQIPGIDSNVGFDAIEIPILVNFSEEDIQVQVGIELYEGPAPNYIKYVWFDADFGLFSVDEYDTASGTVYGHANAAGAEAVGASAWYQTEEWGSPLRPQCFPACLNSFSSAGGVPVFFGRNGRRLPLPDVRLKPGVTGPDGGNTSFFLFDLGFEVPGTTEPDGIPNFFGTSASAPHVAAVAALLLDQRARDIAARKRFIGPRNLTPDLIYWALRLTSDDMKLRNFGGDIGPQRVDNAQGFDFDTGFGFVDAQRALRATRGF
ncbi:MAG: peptidase S8 [Steroidobacteraceae bacterium]|nr:peptidase S8 [Steroidobacteraceae bacterium]